MDIGWVQRLSTREKHDHVPEGELNVVANDAQLDDALEDLADDAFRRGGVATVEDFDGAVSRFALDSQTAADLLEQALAQGLMAPLLSQDKSDTLGVLSSERSSAMDSGGVVPEALDLLFDRASRYPILDAAGERQLARKIEVSLRTSEKAANSHDSAVLENRAQSAKNEFVCANIRLVASIAKNYRNQGIEYPDLIQYGVIGLNRAVEKFDWRKGFKFSTYATHWIRQSIERSIANYGRAIRIPVHQIEKLRKIRAVEKNLVRSTGRDPSLAEISERLEMDLAEVAFLIDISQDVVSLDTPLGHEAGGATMIDLLVDPERSIEESVTETDERDRLYRALEELSYRERRVIEMRYGLRSETPKTLDEVGQLFNVTRERIRQIEGQSKAKLRDLLTEYGLHRESSEPDPESKEIHECV